MHHPESNDVICTTQFGFRNKHSCESQLFITIEDFAIALNSNKQVNIEILAFQKSFQQNSSWKTCQKTRFLQYNSFMDPIIFKQ